MSDSTPSDEHPIHLRVLSVATGVFVTLLAVGAFALSFDALKHLAEENGVTAELTWVWPLVLDGAIIVFSLSALRASIHRESIRYPMTLVVIATATSIIFNVAHASEGVLAHSMAAMPPLFLFLSFELLMRQLRSEVERSSKLASLEELTSQIETMEQSRLKLFGQVERLASHKEGLQAANRSAKSASVQELLDKANVAKAYKIEARRAEVAKLSRQDLSPKEIAEALDVSSKTVKRDLAALSNAA